MADASVESLIIPAAGVHVMLPDHFSPSRMGLIVPKTSDGRVLFFLPWEGSTIAGTTDSETELTMLPQPKQAEINFIIQESNRFLSCSVKVDDAIAAWSGIRPLVKDPLKMGEGTKALSRSHVVEVLPSGLITITGGKWTTFRRMAEDTVDAVLKNFPEINSQGYIQSKCKTSETSLIGADRAGVVCGQNFDRICVTLRGHYGLSNEIARHLVSNYGTRALQIAEIAVHRKNFVDKAGHPLRLSPSYPFLDAEIAFAVEQEYALKAVDILARRTRLAFIDEKAARKAIPKVVELMAKMLGWNRHRITQELKECNEFIDTMSPNCSSNGEKSKLHQ
jgi:glycerol-3-phosphate dehydrogenase